MSYVDETELDTLINDLNDSVPTNLKSLAIKASDRWVESELTGITISNNDNLIVSSSTYFAYAFILRKLYDTDEGESNTAKWFETLAKEDIGKYINKADITDSLDSPYSSKKSKPYSRSRRILLW